MSVLVKPGNTRCEQMLSAPHPIADIEQWDRHVRVVPTRDSCIAAKSFLFDHLVGEREQRGGKFDTNRFCRLEVDHQFEPGWLHHW